MEEAHKFYGFIFHKPEPSEVSGHEHSVWPKVRQTRKPFPREEIVPGWGQVRGECGVVFVLSPWESARLLAHLQKGNDSSAGFCPVHTALGCA